MRAAAFSERPSQAEHRAPQERILEALTTPTAVSDSSKTLVDVPDG
jgi:hypothetical protein